MTDITDLPKQENVANQKSRVSGWPDDVQYNEVYHEVDKVYSLNIPFDQIYDHGQKMGNYKLTSYSQNRFVFMLMFLHAVEKACMVIGLPGVTEANRRSNVGMNARGGAVKKIVVDKQGNVIRSNGMATSQKIIVPDGLANIISNTNAVMSKLLDCKRKLHETNIQQIPNIIQASVKQSTTLYKNIEKAIERGQNRIPTTNSNERIENNIIQDEEDKVEGKTIYLPPIEVVVEYIQSCNLAWKKKVLKNLTEKKKQKEVEEAEKNPIAMRDILLDDEDDEDKFAFDDYEDDDYDLKGKRRKLDISTDENGVSMMDISFDSNSQPSFIDEKEMRLFDEIWGSQVTKSMKNPKFKAFVDACSRLYGTGCIGITIHVLIRTRIDFASIINDTLRENMAEYATSIRATASLSKKQQAYLIIGNENFTGEEHENDDIFSEFLDNGNNEGHGNKPKQLPTLKKKDRNTKNNAKLYEYELFKIIRKPEHWGKLCDLYTKDSRFAARENELSVDYSFKYGPGNPLNANEVFTLLNAIRDRSHLCHPVQDLDYWTHVPETYVDYEQCKPGEPFTLRIPGAHVILQPESIFPANFIEKTLPHVDQALYSSIERMHPAICNKNHEAIALRLHHGPEYPYDPSVIPPPKVGEKYLTLNEIKLAKKWLDAFKIDYYSTDCFSNIPNFTNGLKDANVSNKIKSLKDSIRGEMSNTKNNLLEIPSFIQYAHPREIIKEIRKFYRNRKQVKNQIYNVMKIRYKQNNQPLPSGAELNMILETETRMKIDYIAQRNVEMSYTSFLLEEYGNFMNERDGYLINHLEKINTNVLSGLNKSFTLISNNVKAKRAIYKMYQKNACDLYDLTARGSHSNISDAGLVLVEHQNLYRTAEPAARTTFYKYDMNLSNMHNVLGQFLYSYKNFYFGFRPGLIYFIWICSLDGTRHNFGTHMDVMIQGDGANSKSLSAKVVANDLRANLDNNEEGGISLRSTSQEIFAFSAKADQVDTKGLTNDMFIVDHEMNLENLKDNKEGGGCNAAWKKKMDDHVAVTMAAYLDNGDVKLRMRKKEMIGTTTNILNHTLHGVEQSGVQRSLQVTVTDPTNIDERIQDSMTKESNKSKEDIDTKKKMNTQHHILQQTKYHLDKLIRAKVVVTSSFVGMYVIFKVCDDLTKNIGLEINPRATKYLLLGGMLYEFLDVFIGEFFSPGGRFYNKPITTDSICALEPYLYMNSHHVVASIGTFFRHVIPQGISEVRLALKEQLRVNITMAPGITYDNLFRRKWMSAGQNDETPEHDKNERDKVKSSHNARTSKSIIDWQYVTFKNSITDLAAKLVGYMKGGEIGSTEAYAVRHVQYILWNLTRTYIRSHKYHFDKVDLTKPPVRVGKEKFNIPIAEIDEHRNEIHISWEFLNYAHYDIDVCLKRSLREIFNTEHQPVCDYMWGYLNDCTPYFTTLRLGKGMTSDLDQQIPKENTCKKKMIFPNLNFVSKKHLKYIAQGGLTKDTADSILKERKASIIVDTSLDLYGAMKHAELCHFPCTEKMTRREMLSNVYNYNEILTKATAVAENMLDMNDKEKRIFKKLVKDVIKPFKEKTEQKRIQSEIVDSIPANFQSHQYANNIDDQCTDNSEESKAVRRILDAVDNTEDVDLPSSECMVPVFRNDKEALIEYYKSVNTEPYEAVHPQFESMQPHWVALGLTFEQYKTQHTTPLIREDKYNRWNAYDGKGTDVYPNIIIDEMTELRETKSKINEIINAETQEEYDALTQEIGFMETVTSTYGIIGANLESRLPKSCYQLDINNQKSGRPDIPDKGKKSFGKQKHRKSKSKKNKQQEPPQIHQMEDIDSSKLVSTMSHSTIRINANNATKISHLDEQDDMTNSPIEITQDGFPGTLIDVDKKRLGHKITNIIDLGTRENIKQSKKIFEKKKKTSMVFINEKDEQPSCEKSNSPIQVEVDMDFDWVTGVLNGNVIE